MSRTVQILVSWRENRFTRLQINPLTLQKDQVMTAQWAQPIVIDEQINFADHAEKLF